MTRDDIISMAREANLHWYVNELNEEPFLEIVERFATLAAAAERERLEATAWGASQKWIDRAIESEREACAKVCENGTFLHDFSPEAVYSRACARAIRARGQV